jgi:predicted 3-demethylubiquinone-9 3-methyltransferase (glyoxalase superfamily)
VKATPFLMFQGQGQQALALYREAFPDFALLLLKEHPADGAQAGQILSCHVRIGGLEIMLFDSPPVHEFSFTPATSFMLDCDDEAQLRALAARLGEGGKVMMQVDNYGFSTLFTWVGDRFGVSWQLNLK